MLAASVGALANIGLRVVSSAQEYRENAEECIGWARTARTDSDTFLQMARTWIEAAERLESLPSPIINSDPNNEIAAK